MFTKSSGGNKSKIARSPVIVHKSGDIEANCPRCRRGVIIGQAAPVLRKAQPMLVVRTRQE